MKSRACPGSSMNGWISHGCSTATPTFSHTAGLLSMAFFTNDGTPTVNLCCSICWLSAPQPIQYQPTPGTRGAPQVHFAGYTYVGEGPLFTQQYAQAWVDFRGRRDQPPSNVDFFQNSMIATEANSAFCISLRRVFPKSYSENVWGITASDGPNGY